MNELISNYSDRPLQIPTALNEDKLDRRPFVDTVVSYLKLIGPENGLVLSIEGRWGSGKTSTLAMIEAVLNKDEVVLVRFNPWLVGNREALLQEFFSNLGEALKQPNHAKTGEKIAKHIEVFSGVCNSGKEIPIMGPVLKTLQSVSQFFGQILGFILGLKKLSIEDTKKQLAASLKNFDKKIVVMIDDMDRLFPAEIFEMIRIVKAVGDFPNIVYVLALDPEYIEKSLANLQIPQSESYLEKIVQFRLSLPVLSDTGKTRLFKEALTSLGPEAQREYFPEGNQRLQLLSDEVIKPLMEQPRDVYRMFNVVRHWEPALREEIVLSDIIGLALLQIKSPGVFEIVKKHPEWFTSTGENHGQLESDATKRIEQALLRCFSPERSRKLLHALFPVTHRSESEQERTLHSIRYSTNKNQGHVGHFEKLKLVLQNGFTPSDLRITLVRKFIQEPEQREELVQRLTPELCSKFLEAVGQYVAVKPSLTEEEVTVLCLAISGLPDRAPFTQVERGFLQTPMFHFAMNAIRKYVDYVSSDGFENKVADQIVMGKNSLSVSSDILWKTFIKPESRRDILVCTHNKHDELIKAQHEALLTAIENRNFFRLATSTEIFFSQAKLSPTGCPELYQAMESIDPTLDLFVKTILMRGRDNIGGDYFGLPSDNLLDNFCDKQTLLERGKSRLLESDLELPAKAAWMSLMNGAKYYAKNCDPVESDW